MYLSSNVEERVTSDRFQADSHGTIQPYDLRSHFDGIICFGGEDWWYHHRAHFDMQVMRCMAKRLPVLYVNSVGFAMPRVQEGSQFLKKIGRKLKSVARSISSPFPGFYVASPFSVPLWHRPGLAKLNVQSLRLQVDIAAGSVGIKDPMIWVACPTAYDVVRSMRTQCFLVYQRTDKYEEYSNQSRDYILAADRWLSARAELILYTSAKLYEEESCRKSKSLLVGQGVELSRFNPEKALEGGVPLEIVNLKRPIVGFFGDIDNSLVDVDLIAKTIRASPEASFVFLGRIVSNVGAIRSLPNAYLLGKKAYEDVPRYGVHFDVAIMPWNRNRWIRYCNPIKLKEYLALGLPTVSVEFPEVLRYSDVMYVAHDEEDFVRGIREAIHGRGIGTVESRRARVAGDTWEQATLRIIDAIRNKDDTRLRRLSDAMQD
jgi:Glycosyl transferases group 1